MLGGPISVFLRRMKEADSPKKLFENLDLTPIHPILWTPTRIEAE